MCGGGGWERARESGAGNDVFHLIQLHLFLGGAFVSSECLKPKLEPAIFNILYSGTAYVFSPGGLRPPRPSPPPPSPHMCGRGVGGGGGGLNLGVSHPPPHHHTCVVVGVGKRKLKNQDSIVLSILHQMAHNTALATYSSPESRVVYLPPVTPH